MSTVLDALNDALGPVIREALADPDTQDVIAREDGGILIRRHGKVFEQGTIDERSRRAVLIYGAHLGGRYIRLNRASLSVILPGSKARLKGHIPPLVESPSFTIRRPAPQVFDLQSYIEGGVMTASQVRFLSDGGAGNRVAIVGEPGGGKSTLLNAILALPGYENLLVVMCEDEAETVLPKWGRRILTDHEADPPWTMQKLVQDTLRMMTQAICIGEVRGPEALDLVMAWNTGLKGLCSYHARSARAAVARLGEMVALNSGVIPSRSEIAHALDVIVHIEQRPDGKRRVTEVLEVVHHEDGQWSYREVV